MPSTNSQSNSTSGALAAEHDQDPLAPLLPGIYSSPDGEHLYLRDDNGFVIAVHAATGEIAWRAEHRLELLGSHRDAVLGYGITSPPLNELRLVRLERDTGQPLPPWEPLELPTWSSVAGELGKKFAARLEKADGGLLLRWSAGSFYAGGARPTEEVLDNARRDGYGTFRIGSDGAVEVVDAQESRGAPAANTQVVYAAAKLPYWTSFAWQGDKFSTAHGDVQLALESSDPDGGAGGDSKSGKRLVARAAVAGSGASSGRTLAQGEQISLLLPADKVLLVKVNAPASAPLQDPRLMLFERSTLEPLGQFDLPQRALSVASLEPLVLAVVEQAQMEADPSGGQRLPRQLVAWDMRRGEERWRVPTMPRVIPQYRPR